jgi:hypothetical protein
MAPLFHHVGTCGKESASLSRRFTRRERVPGIHWIEGWVGARAGMDATMEKELPTPVGNRAFVTQPVTSFFADKVILVPDSLV